MFTFEQTLTWYDFEREGAEVLWCSKTSCAGSDGTTGAGDIASKHLMQMLLDVLALGVLSRCHVLQRAKNSACKLGDFRHPPFTSVRKNIARCACSSKEMPSFFGSA